MAEKAPAFRITARRAWALAGLAILLTLSIEMGLRARIAFNEDHVFDNDGLFRYRPDTNVGHDSSTVTNNHGFFGVDLATPKPASVNRIFILGSSAIASPELAQVVNDSLALANPERKFEVNTVGIPRYTSYHNALLFEKYLLPLEPDCLVLYLGLNDNVYNTFPYLNDRPYDGFYDPSDFTRSVALDMFWYQAVTKRFRVNRNFTEIRSAPIFERHLRRILDGAKTRGIRVIFVQIHVAWPTDDPALSAVIRRNEGPMSHFWGTLDASLRGLAAHHTVINRLGDEYGVPVFDPTEILSSESFRDLCHFTQDGIDTLGNFMARAIVDGIKLPPSFTPPSQEGDQGEGLL